jgi:hypothetical protein
VLSLRPLLVEALKDVEFRRGDVKLFASVATPLPGLSVKPRSTQPRQLTLVVANLAYADTPPPKQDSNAPWHFAVDAERTPLETDGPPGPPLPGGTP